MIGRVIAGLHEGCSVYKVADQNAFYIMGEKGEKIYLTKRLVESISNISNPKDVRKKCISVVWLDGNTSIIQFGTTAPTHQSTPVPQPNRHNSPSKQKGCAPKRNVLPLITIIVVLAIALALCAILVTNDAPLSETNAPTENESIGGVTESTIFSEPPLSTTAPSTIQTVDASEEIIEIDSNNISAQYWKLSQEQLQYPATNDMWSYDVYETHIVITGYLGSDSVITFPKEIGGLPVKGIGPALNQYNPFEIVTIPDTIVYFRLNAFSQLPIRQVIFDSDNKIYFETGVFGFCEQLENMDDIVAHIYGDTIPEQTFDAKWGIGDEYELRPNQDKELHLPSNIKFIGRQAFCGQKGLCVINLENIETIGSEAFFDCSSLQNVDLSSLKSFQSGAFAGTKSFTEITLYNVETIPHSAFKESGVEVVDLGIAKTIGEEAFYSLFHNLRHIYVRNPDCEIDFFDFDYLVEYTLTVHGLAGSTAAEFARRHGCTFELIKD